jgi:hypothetical protein
MHIASMRRFHHKNQKNQFPNFAFDCHNSKCFGWNHYGMAYQLFNIKLINLSAFLK